MINTRETYSPKVRVTLWEAPAKLVNLRKLHPNEPKNIKQNAVKANVVVSSPRHALYIVSLRFGFGG